MCGPGFDRGEQLGLIPVLAPTSPVRFASPGCRILAPGAVGQVQVVSRPRVVRGRSNQQPGGRAERQSLAAAEGLAAFAAFRERFNSDIDRPEGRARPRP